MRIVVTELIDDIGDDPEEPFAAEVRHPTPRVLGDPLPERRGTYTVELDVSTLPDGVSLDAGDATARARSASLVRFG